MNTDEFNSTCNTENECETCSADEGGTAHHEETFNGELPGNEEAVQAASEDPYCASLLAKIAELEALIERQNTLFERRRAELAEFAKIFPNINADSLPDDVIRQNEGGIPLAAAYALYEKIRQNELNAALENNKKNAESLNTSVCGGVCEPYFSAEEVKRMSSSQVKENFSYIKRSMMHWAKK